MQSRILEVRHFEVVVISSLLAAKNSDNPRSVPAVVIDGKLAGCCAGRGPDEHVLRSALA